MAKSTIYNFYNDLVKAVSPIVGTKYTFLKDRPKIVPSEKPMEKFIVVDLPVSIDDYVIGKSRVHLTTSGVFYLFTQSRANDTLDVNIMGDFIDSVVDLFPISGDTIVASNPVVQMTGSDGKGFQVTTVSFDVHSK